MALENFKNLFKEKGCPTGVWDHQLLAAWFTAACPTALIGDKRLDNFVLSYATYCSKAPILSTCQLHKIHPSRVDQSQLYISTGAGVRSLKEQLLPTTTPIYKHAIVRLPTYSFHPDLPLTYALVFALLYTTNHRLLTGRTQTIYSSNTDATFTTRSFFFLSVRYDNGKVIYIWVPRQMMEKVLNGILMIANKTPAYFLSTDSGSDLYLYKRIRNKFLPDSIKPLLCIQD